MRKKSYITLTDQFCGAGGSSIGAKAVMDKIGGKVAVALNHWALAIETHNTNFPDTLHDCTDISACDPRRYPSTDILLTSPECTNHSLAKGVKSVKAQMDMFATGKLDPAAERSRATMWDVPRFAEYHKYNIIIVENVVDARKWVMFDAWLHAMHALGYNHKCVYLNSMFCHPTPQSRDRMYVVFWKKGNKAPKLDFTPQAWCHQCEKNIYAIQTWKKSGVNWGVYGKRGQYVYCCASCSNIVDPYYYAAFNCIDWSDLGQRIGDRKKNLADNTIKRIQYGLDKYGKEPLIITQKYHGEDPKQSAKGVTEAIRTQPSQAAHGVCTPFIIDDKQTTGIDFRVKSVLDRTPTVHTDPRLKIVMPFIIKAEHTNTMNVRPVTDAWHTQTRTDSLSFVTPLVVEMHGTGKARKSTEPINTATAGGIKSGILTPPPTLIDSNNRKSEGLLSSEAWNSFVSHVYGNGYTRRITESLGGVRTKAGHELVSFDTPKIEDCYYRMLKPHEIKIAMAFGAEYKVLGSGKDQVKQLGNAVTPPAMQWLVQQCVDSLK